MTKKLSGLYGALLLGLGISCIGSDLARAFPLPSDEEQVTVKPPYIIRQQTLARNLSGMAQEERLTIQSSVSYADLDFSKQADVDVMRDRLRKAARDNCRQLHRNPHILGYIPTEEAACGRTARLQSFAQLDQIRATVRQPAGYARAGRPLASSQ